jgi:hypothetical protein
MTMIAKSVKVVGTIGAWGAAIVSGLATFLIVGIVVIGAGSMSVGKVAVLLVVTVVAGKIAYSAVLGWVGRRAVLMREAERLNDEAMQRETEAQAAEVRRQAAEVSRKAAWDADEPRRAAEWIANAPQREAEASIRTEIETRVRIEREVTAAEDARRGAAQQAQQQQQVASYNQQAAAINHAAAQRQQLVVNRLAYLRTTAARMTWLPGDLRTMLQLRATSTLEDEASVYRLDMFMASLQKLERALRDASRNPAQHDLVISEIRRLFG